MSNLSQPKCEYCEKTLRYEEQFVCQHCKGIFCTEHRLPPKHDCPLIALWNLKQFPKKDLPKTSELKTSKFERLKKKFLTKRRKT